MEGADPGSPPDDCTITPVARPASEAATLLNGKSCSFSPFTAVTADAILRVEVVP